MILAATRPSRLTLSPGLAYTVQLSLLELPLVRRFDDEDIGNNRLIGLQVHMRLASSAMETSPSGAAKV